MVPRSAPATAARSPGYTIEQHEAALARREAALRADLERAHRSETNLIGRQLADVERQKSDLQASYDERVRELAALRLHLPDEGEGIADERVRAAQQALDEGDTSEADEIYAEVVAMEADSVDRSANANFRRGQIAEGEVRWADAAKYYALAAAQDPTYEHLFAARDLNWKTGDYNGALALGDDLINAAREEFSEGSFEFAEALNEHALSLGELGRYHEAENFIRRSIDLHEKNQGKEDREYANGLVNLAFLMKYTGRYKKSEQLYRESLSIQRNSLGKLDDLTPKTLNNLGVLLIELHRYQEAEELLDESVTIFDSIYNQTHPDYGSALSNLGRVFMAKGEYRDAEELLRRAVEIRAGYPGQKHSLRYLAVLMEKLMRYKESRELYLKSFRSWQTQVANQHPSVVELAHEFARLLRAQFPADPVLIELESIYGPDIGQ